MSLLTDILVRQALLSENVIGKEFVGHFKEKPRTECGRRWRERAIRKSGRKK